MKFNVILNFRLRGLALSTILDEIVAHKLSEIERAKDLVPLAQIEELCETAPLRPDFLKAIESSSGVSLIAEVKKASPSKGLIRADFDPVAIANAYAQNGATCISVLTDEKYFQGHLDYLTAITDNVSVPVLRKEFVIDPYQVYEAKVHGASAVLLIAECLAVNQLKELHDQIVELGMTPLVEFHEAENLRPTLDSGARLIGVNNRDLKTFQTDLNHVVNMRKEIPPDRLVVAESGIFTNKDVEVLEENQIQAMLVGESLMRQDDIGAAVKALLGTG